VIYVIVIYAVASIILILNLFADTLYLKRFSQGLIVLCASAHLIFTISLGLSIGEVPLVNMFQALNMMILIASIFFVIAVLIKNLLSLGVFFAPFAAFVLSLISNRLDTNTITVSHSEFWFRFHTLSVISGDALFIIAAIASLVYIIHQKLIKSGSIHNAASTLPPLSFLDRVISITLSLGFIAITAGMIIGGLWASDAGLDLSMIAPKIISGALTWLIMAFTLHQRFAIGWRGYRTAVMTLAGFAFVAVLTILIEISCPAAHGLRILP